MRGVVLESWAGDETATEEGKNKMMSMRNGLCAFACVSHCTGRRHEVEGSAVLCSVA